MSTTFPVVFFTNNIDFDVIDLVVIGLSPLDFSAYLLDCKSTTAFSLIFRAFSCLFLRHPSPLV